MSNNVARTNVEISKYNSTQVRSPSLSLSIVFAASSAPSHFPRAMSFVIRKSHSPFNEHRIPVPIEKMSERAEKENKHLAE